MFPLVNIWISINNKIISKQDQNVHAKHFPWQLSLLVSWHMTASKKTLIENKIKTTFTSKNVEKVYIAKN